MAYAPPNVADTPSPEEMIARARAFAPKLRERAEACDRARQVPDVTIAEFLDAGFHKILQPARYGGYEMGWDTQCEVAIEFARACASQGWVLNVYGDHVHKIGMCSREVQDEIWGEDPRTLMSTSFAPMGKAEKTKGGYSVSGRWSFSSGIDHAQWLLFGALLPHPETGAPDHTFFIAPKKEAKIVDDWHVAGLSGTGSKSFVLDGVFVPPYRTIRDADANNGRGPGVTADSAPVYRFPRRSAALGLAAVPVGAAFGMLEDFVALARDRAKRGRRTVSDPATALRIAETASELDAARLLLVESARTTMATVARGEPSSLEQRLANRRNSGYAAMLAARASERLFAAAGGNAIYQTSRLQRAFRDIHAAANHIGTSWDFSAQPFGEHALGYPVVADEI
jgi:alkylation response protein AidB-like acyl-CoA dehydrogenase